MSTHGKNYDWENNPDNVVTSRTYDGSVGKGNSDDDDLEDFPGIYDDTDEASDEASDSPHFRPSSYDWTDYNDWLTYGTGRSTSKAEPWSEQIPYLKKLFSEASNLYGKSLTYLPEGWSYEDMIAAFTPEQTTAQGMVTNRALGGSSLLDTGQNMLESTLGGDYLSKAGDYLSPDTNPYLSYYVDQATKSVMPKLDNSAIQAGRYGSGAWSDMKSDVASKVANEIYGGAYKDERDNMMEERKNMMDALKYGVNYSREDYYDPAMLSAVGEEKQDYQQSLVDAALSEHQFNQYADWWKAAQYKNLISGDYGGQAESTYPITATKSESSSTSDYGDMSWLTDLFNSLYSSTSSDDSDSSDWKTWSWDDWDQTS